MRKNEIEALFELIRKEEYKKAHSYYKQLKITSSDINHFDDMLTDFPGDFYLFLIEENQQEETAANHLIITFILLFTKVGDIDDYYDSVHYHLGRTIALDPRDVETREMFLTYFGDGGAFPASDEEYLSIAEEVLVLDPSNDMSKEIVQYYKNNSMFESNN